MRTVFLCALCVLCGLSLSAQVLLRWEVDTARSAPKILEVYQGETVNFEVAIKESGAVKVFPDTATAVFLWQTNGMESAWWSQSASVSGSVVRATWSPSNDVGNASYTWYVAVIDSATINYRVNGTLRIRDSPGFLPASLASPAIFEQLKTTLLGEMTPTNTPTPAAVPTPLVRAALFSDSNTAWSNTSQIFVWDLGSQSYNRTPQLDLGVWVENVQTNAVYDIPGTTNQTVVVESAWLYHASPIVDGVLQRAYTTYSGWRNGATNTLTYGTNTITIYSGVARYTP